MVSGHLGKKMVQVCTSGVMGITMMDNGKRTQPKVLVLHVLGVYFMMANSISGKNTVLGKKLMKTAIL